MPDTFSLEDQIRDCFGRVIYTHKTHEKMADRCSATLRRLKLSQIVLSALTACGAISIVFVESFELKLVTALVSFITLLVSGYMKGFDPGGTAQKHRDAAANLWGIRESYLSLLTDLHDRALSAADAIKQRDALQKKLDAVYRGSPQTTPKAYAEAQAALKAGNEYSFTPEEIDSFVPTSLKRNQESH